MHGGHISIEVTMRDMRKVDHNQAYLYIVEILHAVQMCLMA